MPLASINSHFLVRPGGGANVTSPYLRWSYTGNGTAQSYDLPDAFGLLPSSYLVYIDGVVQDPINFTISNTNPIAINFSAAIPNGSVVTIVSLGGATPSTDVTDYTATPDNSSTSNTIGYWLGQSAFNQDSNYQVTGTPTARSLATRGGDVINVKDYGATGNGTTDDTAAIQAAITAAPAGAAIYFPKGIYRLANIDIAKTISIYGDGKNATTLSLRNPNDFRMFFINTSWISFEIFDLTMRDPHGFRVLNNTIQEHTTGITNINRPTYNPYQFPLKNFYVKNVDFIDFYDGIETSGLQGDVSGCNFIYTYGGWSVGGNWDALNGGGNHPFVGILCSFWNLNFTNNFYDGLLDSTFANVNPLTATYPLSKRASDGMIYAQSLRTSLLVKYAETNGIKSVQTIANNVCKNNAIEGIQVNTALKNETTKNNYYINISNNEIIGVNKIYGIPPSQPANWPVGSLAILVSCYYFRPIINISDNKIDNNITGIAVNNIKPDDVPLSSFTGIWTLQGQTKITNNSISGCQTGIYSSWNLPEDVISNNSIFCNAENAKTLFGDFTPSVLGNYRTQELIAINIVNGNPTVSYNNASANYSFEQIKTISANPTSNVLTLNNITGMSGESGGSATILYGGIAWWFPIDSISGNDVTLNNGFWYSFTIYWSTRGGFNLNGVIFYWTPKGTVARSSFLWAILNQGGGGNGWVTPSPLNKVYNNTASDFMRDFSTWNSSVTFEKQIYFSNMTSNNIYQKTYLIQFGIPSSNAILNGGFYLDI